MLHYAVVEDINDPEKIGRVKVRVHSIHTPNKNLLSTEDLLWSNVIMPVTSASHLGSGQMHGLLVGSHVVGYFLDGAMQQFVVLGVVQGNGVPSMAMEHYPQNRCHVSEKGHNIQFNDSEDSVTLQHSKGSMLKFFMDESGFLGTKDLVIDATGNTLFTTHGNRDDIIHGKARILAGGELVLSSQKRILLAAPSVDMNPAFGLPRSEYQEANSLAAKEAKFSNSDILNDNPFAPTNNEVIDGGATYGNICLTGDPMNPYDYLMTQMDKDWTEKSSPDRNPNIAALHEELGFKTNSDSVAWCAALLGATLKRCKLKYIRTLSSRAYAVYGQEVEFEQSNDRVTELDSKLRNAQKGDILVFSRGGGFGHVGFFTGEYDPVTGKFGCLGGNQGNTLRISYFNIKSDRSLLLTNVRKIEPCRDKTLEEIAKGDMNCEPPKILNDNDVFQMFVRNLYYEARGDKDDVGLIAISWVVINRAKLGRQGIGGYPSSELAVIKQPYAFSWYNRNVSTRNEIPSDSAAWARCCKITKEVLLGNHPDPTGGAMAYYASGSRDDESFAKLFGLPIKYVGDFGQHRFFRLA